MSSKSGNACVCAGRYVVLVTKEKTRPISIEGGGYVTDQEKKKEKGPKEKTHKNRTRTHKITNIVMSYVVTD